MIIFGKEGGYGVKQLLLCPDVVTAGSELSE